MVIFHAFIYQSLRFQLMVTKELTKEDCERIAKLIDEGHQIKDLAKWYGLNIDTVYQFTKSIEGYSTSFCPLHDQNKELA